MMKAVWLLITQRFSNLFDHVHVFMYVYMHTCVQVFICKLTSCVTHVVYFGKLIAPSLYGKLTPRKVYFSLQVTQLLAEM